MVAQFLRLKLQLLANSFRRKPLQLVGMILALLYGLGFAYATVAGLIALRLVEPDVARSVIVVFGSLVVLGFFVLPLAFGVDDTIDPRRFSLFGISNHTLAVGIVVSALISLPSLVISVVAVAQIVTWSRAPLPTLLAIVATPLIVATCVLGARVSTAIASFLLSSRRARDITGLIAVIGFVLLAPLLALLSAVDWQLYGLVVLERVAKVLAWTPLGAVWSVPADAAVGDVTNVLAKLAIAVVFVGALWFGWRLLIARMLVSPERLAPIKTYQGLGWFATFSGTPTGAIAARSITYWGRDARYRISLIIIPLIPVLPMLALAIAGVEPRILALIPLPLMCLFLSWVTLHNDVAYDNTAVWLHIASDTRGWQDRLGRAVPVLVIGVPLIAVGSLVTAWFWGDWSWLPSIIGFSGCVLLIGVGLSSILSARFPYPVVRPGDSPFAQPQSSGSGASLIQSLSFVGLVLLSAPVGFFIFLAVVMGPEWHFTALVGGLAIGVIVCVVGIALGGRIWDRRSPELLEFALQN